MSGPLSLRRVPLRAIRAHPVRTAVVLVLGLAQAACVFSGLVLVQGARQELSLAERRLGADILVYPTAALQKIDKDDLTMLGTPVECHRQRSALSRMGSNADIESVSYQIYIRDAPANGDGEATWIIGYEPQTDFVIAPWLEEGDGAPGEGVVAGSDAPVDAAGTVTLFGRPWPVTARLARTGSELDRAVLADMDTLGRLIDASLDAGVDTYASLDPHRDYSVALVRVADRSRTQSVTDWINIHVRKVTAVGSGELLTGTASAIRGHSGAIIALAAVAWLIMLAALATAQSMLMNQRRGELRVWRTIGASRATIERVMVHEALVIHAAGACAGVALALPLLAASGPATAGALAPARALPAAGAALLVSLLVGCASTWLTVRRAARALDGQELLTP